jgi:hypothetical protein
LRELAGLSRLDATDVAVEVLNRSLRELDVQPASPCTARLAVARQIAAGILAGAVSERIGTRRIYFALGDDWDDHNCAPIKARWLELDDNFDRLTYDVPEHDPDLDRLQQSVHDAAQALLTGRS